MGMPGEKTVHAATLGSLLMERARAACERPFILFGEECLSYRELAVRAASYASALRDLSVERGDRVALLLPNGLEFVTAFFGNALAGAVSLPLNALLKPPEIAFQLKKTRAKVVIYGERLSPVVGAVRGGLDSVLHWVSTGDGGDVSFPTLIERREEPWRDQGRPDEVAAILFTSGTTGRPKGAMLTHANYLANARQIVSFVRMDETDRPLCVLPLFHVNAQVVTLLAPLYAGGSLALLPGFDRKGFLPALAKYKATSFSAVPTIYAVLLTLPDIDRYDLSSLRYCICGAAPMPVDLFERFERTFNAKIVEGYGLTEGTCASSVNPVDGPRKVGTIGIPLPQQQMELRGDDGNPVVEPGRVGEIVICGPNVMRGYFEDEEATKTTIVDGWLLTGDLATRDEDGYFTIVGRKKELIIRGGENIYPKEIEEAVYRHPAVLEAAVIGIPDKIYGEEVALCLVPKPGESVDEEAIVEYLRREIADFKLPRRVKILEALPKTATGKIRKGVLRDAF